MTHSQPLRVAIVGAGLMGRWHAHAAVRAGGRVAVVVDPDRVRAERLAALYRGCRVTTALHDALADVQVVHLCTPSATHIALARESLAAGRHVLVEKPLAPAAAATAALLNLADSHRVLLCPVHQFPFQHGVRRALHQLGSLGPLHHVDVTMCSAGAESAEPSARARIANEILPHPLSLLQRLLPMAVSDLEWYVQRPEPGEIRAVAQAGRASVWILVSMRGRPTANRLRLIGAQGTTEVDLFHGFAVTHPGTVSRRRKIAQPFAQAITLATAAAVNLGRRAWRREPAYPGLRELVADFYRAAAGGGPCPISPVETLAVARACDRLAPDPDSSNAACA